MAAGEARMPEAGSLPPRSALPRDVDIPELPLVGITWYDRGKGYWVRRVRTTLVGAPVLLGVGLFVAGFLNGARSSSYTAFVVLVVIEVAILAASMVFFAVRIARRWNVPSLPTPFFPPHRGRVQLAILAAGLVSFFFPGFYVAMFLTFLLPEPLTERQARLWMEGELRERGIIAPGARIAA
jgi:hypothetical protein